jgi:hypothetical protein
LHSLSFPFSKHRAHPRNNSPFFRALRAPQGAIVFSKFDFGEANNKKAKPRQTPQQLLKKASLAV